MAPEQAEGRGEEIDARSDIFALGGILYNILTLHPPVLGSSVAEIVQKVRTGNIAHPSTFNQANIKRRKHAAADRSEGMVAGHYSGRGIVESLSAVAMKAMQLLREERYQTVTEMQRDIEAYQNGFATVAEQASTWKQLTLLIKRHKAAFIVSHAALLILLIAGVSFTVKVTSEKRRAESALRDLRGTAPTFVAQAEALMKEHKFEDALANISHATLLAPTDARYHAMKGNILESLLRFGEAEQAYAEALACSRASQKRGYNVGGGEVRSVLESALPLAEANIKLCQKLRQQNEGRAEVLPSSLSELQAAMRQQGRLDEAVALAMRQRKDNAQAYETWKAVLVRSGLVPSDEIDKRYSMDEAGMIDLLLNSINPASIAPLKGMPVKFLDLLPNGNHEIRLTDLSPLKGMPLEWLNLCLNIHITDLTPLKGMPLKVLSLSNCRSLIDFSPLQGMPLEELNLSNTQMSDLGPLRGMPLRSLDLVSTPVTDLGPLEGRALKTLYFDSNRIADISPLHGMPLEDLHLRSTDVSDLRPLRGMPLKQLDLSYSRKLQDLTPLADCPTLERLILPAQCKDVEFLRRLPHLQHLSFEEVPWDKAPTAAEFWKEYDAKKAGKQ
jgi:tetratricopeptide (TPR) repeat protein